MNVNTPAETNDDTDVSEAVTMLIDLRHMSAMQFAQLGVQQVAYVKPVVFNGAPGFAIHAADGTPMAVAPELGAAIGAIRQHDMLPALVH